jgi:RNA recognition motif-containing protein
MSIKLYVGNLSFKTDSEELKELFEQAGTVEAEVVVEDRDTGRSRGFGFIEMSSKEEGEAAIRQLSGKEFGGRNLTVNEARPRKDPGGREYGRTRRGGEGVQPRNADEVRAEQEVRAQLQEVDEIIRRLGRDREEIERLKEETRSNISELQRMIAA